MSPTTRLARSAAAAMSHHSTLLVYADDNAASAAPTDDYDRGPQILAICGAMVGLALLLVGLRLLVRVRIVRTTLGWDDYFMMAAALVLLAEMIVIVPEVQYGAGRHVQFIEPASNIVTGLHLNFVTQPLCLIALCFTKISVGLFLLRLTSSGGFGRFIWAVIVVTAVSAAGNLCESTYSSKGPREACPSKGKNKEFAAADQTLDASNGVLPMHSSGLFVGFFD